MKILRLFVKSPSGNSINKFQAYAYPDECRKLFDEACKLMTPNQIKNQRTLLNLSVRNIF